MKNKSRKSLDTITHTDSLIEKEKKTTKYKNVTQEKGITMVTLVVTIVIMLILIGITVNLTLGNNGIIERTKQAKKDIEQTALNEQYQMNVLYDEMLSTSGSGGGDISTDGIPDAIVEYIEAKLNVNTKENMLKIYPVGSIYISTEATDPSELFGGTWESYGQGRTLVGVENGQESEQTGGSKTATLTTKNLPSHNHKIPSLTVSTWSGSHTHKIAREWGTNGVNTSPTDEVYSQIAGTGAQTKNNGGIISSTKITVSGQTTSESQTGSVGSGTSFNIQNPYITTYMWKRVS